MKTQTTQIFFDSGALFEDAWFKTYNIRLKVKGFATFLQTEEYLKFTKINSDLKFNDYFSRLESSILSAITVVIRALLKEHQISFHHFKSEFDNLFKLQTGIEIKKNIFRDYGLEMIEYYPEFSLDEEDASYPAFIAFYKNSMVFSEKAKKYFNKFISYILWRFEKFAIKQFVNGGYYCKIYSESDKNEEILKIICDEFPELIFEESKQEPEFIDDRINTLEFFIFHKE